MQWIINLVSQIFIGVFTDAMQTPAVETIVDDELGVIDFELQYWYQGESDNYLSLPYKTNKESE